MTGVQTCALPISSRSSVFSRPTGSTSTVGPIASRRPMAQLSQDCFASGAEILSVDDAVAAIVTRFSPVEETEAVPLADADGRVLARDLIAALPLPPFTNSAVDGYAVRGDDVPVAAERLFRVAGRLAAGARTSGPAVEPGDAVQIGRAHV